MYKIPSTDRRFVQSNRSDRLGNIAQTKNINLREDGYIKLSRKLRTIQNDTTMVDITNTQNGVNAITIKNYNTYLIGDKNMYSNAGGTDKLAFTKNTDTSFPTVASNPATADMISFSGELYVAEGANLVSLSGSTWSTINAINARFLCLFDELDAVAAVAEQSVYLYDQSGTEIRSITLPADYQINGIAYNSGRLYISASQDDEYYSAIVEWDGLSNTYNRLRIYPSIALLGVAAYQNGVVAVSSEGKLVYYEGSFRELDAFPIENKANNWQTFFTDFNLQNVVTKNGIVVDGTTIYVGTNPNLTSAASRNNPDFLADFPGGVWTYTPKTGLYHTASIDGSIRLKTDAITTANINTSTDVITVAGVTVPETGTPVFYYNDLAGDAESNSATPLKHGIKYYTIYVSDTTCKLATTKANANAGTAIDITATGNNDQFLEFVPADSFGGSFNAVTALALPFSRSFNNTPQTRGINLQVGGFTGDSVVSGETVYATQVLDQENRGYFVTSRFESNEFLEDSFTSVGIKYDNVDSEEDKIVVKYRITDEDPRYYITNNDKGLTTQWTDGNTFTTTIDLSDIKTRSDAGIQDEVEVVFGKGSGVLAHITSITESSGTYTVNIDETVPNVTNGDPLLFVVGNWIKLGTIDSDDDGGYKVFTVGAQSKWIQFKVELRGVDVAVEELLVNNKPQVRMI